MPDAEIIPIGPESAQPTGVGPSKAARLVGNTGPQPTPAASSSASRRPPESDTVVADSDTPGIETFDDSWIEFARRRLQGDYEVDDFGFDPELTDRVLLNIFRPLYRAWFRDRKSTRLNSSHT